MATDSYLGFDMGGSSLTLPEISQIAPWALPHQANNFGSANFSTHEPNQFSPGLISARWPYGLQFGNELNGLAPDHQLSQLISESLGQVVHPIGPGPFGLGPFGLQAELHKLTAQEVMDAKALAASRSHSEAERRRRERINNHLARLRSLLPTTTKTDKASLLAEVIQHMKELKRQTSLIAEAGPVPTETDELTVDDASGKDGQRLVRASICCEDRQNLLPDLVNAVKALRLKTLRAEITTLGGRVNNVLFITGEEDDDPFGGGNFFGSESEEWERVDQPRRMSSIREALRAVMEGSGGAHGSASGFKRQRTSGGGDDEYRSF